MDLHETLEDQAFRTKVRAWFERNKPGPLETLEQRRAWHRKLYEAGFVGIASLTLLDLWANFIGGIV